MEDSKERRYARQIQFAPIGQAGQQRIGESSVAVLGCGALGTVASEILARAGVGRLRLVDRDIVEWTNLQRQSLFDEADALHGIAKAEAAAERLTSINGSIEIEPVVVDLTADNIDPVLKGSDLVIDAADNFAIRFLLNDWSLQTQTAWVHGGCVGAGGQVRLFRGDGSPCFRCLVPNPPAAASVATCDTAGVIGAATHAIASLQAMEALKWLSGNRDAVHEKVWSIDFWQNRFRELSIAPELSQDCRACGERQFDFLNGATSTAGSTVVLCGRRAVQITPASKSVVPLKQVAQRWQSEGEVRVNRFFVRLNTAADSSASEIRLTLFADGRAVIEGTDQPSLARSLYDRYVGS
ncbi:ThiF family adenylyltransferase [Novipirellula artificiosorum]|uniref:Molybdopterin-synthase adenylyltransferase n=1 Tax=Novipirellula artificiosorum TaxID=2528016 RepID=A0A5C6DEG9_9BACT|nr:ThiF family adenylyltransferase [Novipirellula artificiosorum]TWU35122.1 Molybdopterin-synthase adenylyltransferase [Novipirellula artificiosorum]